MASYAYKTIKVEVSDRIARVKLNRPNKRNAMNPALHQEMDEALLRLECDDEVGVVILSGEGGNFSAGMDLKEMFREMESEKLKLKIAGEASNNWRWKRLSQFEKPTIAMVQGYCVGGAFTQLIGCDFAIAADNASFSLSEINWGIIPGGLVAKLVADMLLPRHALYHACMGDVFSAAEAERIGLINKAVAEDQLEAEVEDLAHRLLQKSPNALRATKQVMRNVRGMGSDQAYEYIATKLTAMKVGDTQDSYNTGLRQFLDEKSYKPAHGSFKLKS